LCAAVFFANLENEAKKTGLMGLEALDSSIGAGEDGGNHANREVIDWQKKVNRSGWSLDWVRDERRLSDSTVLLMED
jgi:hypothetical protein